LLLLPVDAGHGVAGVPKRRGRRNITAITDDVMVSKASVEPLEPLEPK